MKFKNHYINNENLNINIKNLINKLEKKEKKIF